MTPQERYEGLKDRYENAYKALNITYGHTAKTWFEKGYVFITVSFEHPAIKPTKIRVGDFQQSIETLEDNVRKMTKAVLMDGESQTYAVSECGKTLLITHHAKYDFMYDNEDNFFIIHNGIKYPEVSTAFNFINHE